jgi:hypothetical protein
VILTGEKLKEMAEKVWGRDWPSILGARLDKSSKTLQRWGDDGPPAYARAEIQAALEDQLALVGRYYDEIRAPELEY